MPESGPGQFFSGTAALRLVPLGGTGHRAITVPPSREPVTVGRAQSSGICLPDPAVSRLHAQFTYREGAWLLSDRGSRHGTHVNGTPLEPEVPALIGAGDLLRFGPFSFRVEVGEATRAVTTTEAGLAPGTIIERVSHPAMEGLAERRLDLLIEVAAALHRAPDEATLGATAVEIALAGTGYERGAYLRAESDASSVEVIHAHDPAGGRFAFSRSLLAEASHGQVARLSPGSMASVGQSIIDLGIESALCAPVELDGATIGYIYLDSRASGDRSVEADSTGSGAAFLHAIARLVGLALADLKRSELLARQRRLVEDLNAARLVQEFLGPAKSGLVGPLRYAAVMHPGRFVAGDLFDTYRVGDGHSAICFGDVCGQGMAAAMLMTAMLSHLRAALEQVPSAADAVTLVNKYIAPRSSAETFATLWVGVLDDQTRTLSYVDAGHGHWMIVRADGTVDPVRRPNGLVIGIEPSFDYVADTIPLGLGDRVVLFSDGVVEARDDGGHFYGRERLETVLAGTPGSAKAVDAGMAALSDFLGGRNLDDDTTLAILEVHE